MRNIAKIALLVGIGFSTTVLATEIRTPWIAERGPLRYTFDRLHEDKYNLNSWWVGQYKEAHKAFMSNGIDTKPLSALIFNQSDFVLSAALPNGQNPTTAPNYNPFFSVMEFNPRVNYTEFGMTWGARWDIPVWKKGRIGLRGMVPFRTIEMEREDFVDLVADPSLNFVNTQFVRVVTKADGTGSPATAKGIMATAYNMALVAALTRDRGLSIISGQNPGFNIIGNNIASDPAHVNTVQAALVATNAAGKPVMNAISWATTVAGNIAIGDLDKVVNGGLVPVPDQAVLQNTCYFQSSGNTILSKADGTGDVGSITPSPAFTPIAADGSTLAAPSQTTAYFFNNATNYSGIESTAAFQSALKNYWLVFKRSSDSTDPELFNNGTGTAAGTGATVAKGIDTLLGQFTTNPFQFIDEQGFDLDTQKISSIGDIDLDLFYEHSFSNAWRGELFVGVRFPTDSGNNYYASPYKLQTGNGQHWEIKLGGMLVWQPCKLMNVKLDAYYSFVLKNTEKRSAVFAGSAIKNFGPRADADIDWGYFVGRLDFTFFHPKTDNIRGVVGYEFYYKTEEHWSFKNSTAKAWNGLVAPLSNSLAQANTEAMSHKVRFETDVMINKYCEAFVSASTTFAGEHVMQDRDIAGGFNIRF